jgi:Glycosyltransferase family 87
LVTQQHRPPKGFSLTAAHVERIAITSPIIRSELRRYPDAKPYEYTTGPGQWQVSWFSAPHNGKELAIAYVDDATGEVTEAWSGFQVAWTMARGYAGAFGRISNALYIWLPLCALFVAPFIPWRRPLRRSSWSLLHLDLVMLLGFSISLAFFNHAKIGLSVPLVYPFLVYLLGRLLVLAAGRGRPRRSLALAVSPRWLLVGLLALVGFRIALNVIDSNVIDVGYAGVIGAHRLLHGHALYGVWPTDNANGNTYGPLTYLAYVPVRAIFGWSGTWDSLPAAHAAAIAFDLLTLIGLYLLGRRLARPALGIVFAYLWASYPFTLFALSSNSNDALVSLLVVAALLAAASPAGRGIAVALAGMTKFAPLGLAPLFIRGTDARFTPRRLAIFVAAFVATVAATLVPVLGAGDLKQFWHETIAYQATRPAPFSIWGLWGGLHIEQHIVQGLAVLLAVVAAFVPRRRTTVQVAALAGAILIAVQLGVTYWFYLYLVWFLPPALVALFGSQPLWTAEPQRGGVVGDRDAEPSDARVPARPTALPPPVPTPAR